MVSEQTNRNKSSDLVPTHVQNETECIKDSSLYGLSTNDKLHNMQETNLEFLYENIASAKGILRVIIKSEIGNIYRFLFFIWF